MRKSKEIKQLKQELSRTKAVSTRQKHTTSTKNSKIQNLGKEKKSLQEQLSVPFQDMDVKQAASVMTDKLQCEHWTINQHSVSILRKLQGTLSDVLVAYEANQLSRS